MKDFLKRLFASLAVALVVAVPVGVYAEEGKNAEEADYTLAGMHFHAANVVTMDEATDKDLYVAGSTVTIKNEVNGDVFAASQDLTIEGVIKGDVRVAGSVVTINGTVEGNVLAVGSTIKITKDAKINGYLNAYGATVLIDGTVAKDVHIGGAEVTANGVFNGEVALESDITTIGKDATVVGMINVTSPNEPTVNNDVLKEKVKYTYVEINTYEKSWQDELMGKVSETLYWFFASALIAAVVLYVLSGPIMRSVTTLEKKTGQSVAIGFALLICVPVAAVLLMVTLIGFPLALFTLVLYGLALCLSTIPASLWLGKKLLPSQSDADFRGLFFQYLAGNLIIMILAATPFIGWVVSMIAMVAGLGAYGLVIMNKSAHKKA